MLVADVRKWIADVQSCLGQSSLPVDGVDDLQCELRESQVGALHKFSTRYSSYCCKIWNILVESNHGLYC